MLCCKQEYMVPKVFRLLQIHLVQDGNVQLHGLTLQEISGCSEVRTIIQMHLMMFGSMISQRMSGHGWAEVTQQICQVFMGQNVLQILLIFRERDLKIVQCALISMEISG